MSETPGERSRSDETDKSSTSTRTGARKRGRKPGASTKSATKSPTKTATKSATKSTAPASRSEALTAAAEKPPESKTPATEKPVQLPPPKRTSQYVVTIDNASGLPTKIEKLDAETGEKRELSQAEYLHLGSTYTNPYTNPLTSGFSATPGTSEDVSTAYYRGVMDYLKALNLV